jgi:hypothetical protein
LASSHRKLHCNFVIFIARNMSERQNKRQTVSFSVYGPLLIGILILLVLWWKHLELLTQQCLWFVTTAS